MGKRQGVNLTKTEVLKIQPGPSVARVWDLEERGLGIQVTPGGTYSWVFSYRIHGRKDMLTLGRWPTMTVDLARKAARDARHKLDSGIDPKQAKAEARQKAQEAKRKALTVADLADRYLKEHIPTNGEKWGKEATRLLKKHIIPTLGALPLAKVGPADVSAMLYEMRQTAPTMANRTRAVLRTMFARAEEWEYRPLGTNPVVVVKQRGRETKRDRRLTDLELKTLGLALKESGEGAHVVLALRLALLAGMRKGEIQATRWEWVNLEAGEIRIPKDFHKTGKKTGKDRIIYLCSALVADLRATIPTIGCPYVIPGKPRRNPEGPGTVWRPTADLQAPWKRTREAAGLALDGDGKDDDPGLHDLRRTFASVGADLGLKGFVGELLGHAEQSVTDIYTRSAAARLHEAAEAIGARIAGILAGTIDPEKEAVDRHNGARPAAHA